MKIGIDALGCNHGQSGLGSYLLNFIKNIPKNPQFELELFGLEIDRYIYTTDNEINFVSVNVDDNIKAIRRWHRRGLKKFCRKNKYDVVLFPAAAVVLPNKIKSKAVIIMNGTLSSIENKKDKKVFKKTLLHSNLIITTSKFIKDELEAAGFNSNNIQSIHNGIDHKVFFPLEDTDYEFVDIKPFAIKRPYFIYSSRLSDSNKKHIELIKAFELFKKRTNFPHRLVLTGSDGSYSQKIHQAAYDSEYASEILITGHFPQESLRQLYCGSQACVFPAVNEGSGLPVIEAMACGIPVLCSNKGALPEMGGNAPIYFDSDNAEEIAINLQKIVEDTECAEEMIKKGLAVSGNFNWENTIKETVDAIASLFKA